MATRLIHQKDVPVPAKPVGCGLWIFAEQDAIDEIVIAIGQPIGHAAFIEKLAAAPAKGVAQTALDLFHVGFA
jgi:hypothetical protein